MMTITEKNSVLIVDDEVANIIALTHILSPEYTVYAAKNGRDAIETAKKYLPDVILLDILMPEMDGYEVISLLKNIEQTRTIPVIFVTGLVNAEDEETGLLLGAVDYIAKPFRSAIVRLRIKNQIQILNQIETIRLASVTDQLTSLPNRRAYDGRLSLEWEHARRSQTPLSLILADIDNFKKYNDTYGHMQGDLALQTVAQVILCSLNRSIDFAARWGGEEFVILLPNTDSQGALHVAERIRKNTESTLIPYADVQFTPHSGHYLTPRSHIMSAAHEEHPLSSDSAAAESAPENTDEAYETKERDVTCLHGEMTSLTISIGVHTHMPMDEGFIQDCVAKADQALYAAKKTGKNKVCTSKDI